MQQTKAGLQFFLGIGNFENKSAVGLRIAVHKGAVNRKTQFSGQDAEGSPHCVVQTPFDG
jgi:hypothetical protein